jgi:hypothetical protein
MFTFIPELRRFPSFPPVSEREFWSRIAAQKRLAGLLAEFRDAARAAKGRPVPALPAALYMEFRRTGNRIDYEQPYFERRCTLEALVVTETLEHRGEYLDAVVEYLWSILGEYTWVLPAHAFRGELFDHLPPELFAGDDPLPPPHLPFVDLFAAETAGYLAFTLRLLGDELAAYSANLVRAVREEIERRVIGPTERYLDGFVSWSRGKHNWSPWCCSNLLWVANEILTDDVRFTVLVRKLQTVIDRYFDHYAVDGGCDEGPGYWQLSPGRCAFYAEGLRRASGGTIDLFAMPKFRAMCDYIGYAWYAGKKFASFADFGGRHQVYTGMIRMLARRSGALHSLRMAHDYEAANGLHRQGHTGMAMTLVELTEGPVTAAEIAEIPEEFLHVYPDSQQLHARSGSFYVAMKGGHNGESHNHNDVGQFVFGAGGRLAVADLGTATYTRETFGPRRYENWLQNGFGHNPPVFSGVPQSPGKEFRAGKFEVAGTPDCFTATCDLTPAYPAELGLVSCERRLHFDGRKLTVTDSWRAAKPLAWSVRLFHDGDGVKVSCRGGEIATGKLPLDDSNLRSAWGDSINETRLAAPAAAAGEVTYTIEG